MDKQEALIVIDCCACCARRIETGGIKVKNRAFCNASHVLINDRYIRLCHKAINKARKYDTAEKKGEIDYGTAHFYLTSKLGL